MKNPRGQSARPSGEGDEPDTSSATQLTPHPSWVGVLPAFEKDKLAGIICWLNARCGEFIFTYIKWRLPGQRNKENREDLHIEVLLDCSEWIAKDLELRPVYLMSGPLERLVCYRTQCTIGDWRRKETRWSTIESLDSTPGIIEKVATLDSSGCESEWLVTGNLIDEEWSDADVETLFELLELTAHERRVTKAHLDFHHECQDKEQKFSKRGYRQTLADKLSNGPDGNVSVSYVARHLKSVRAKCRAYLGPSRRWSDTYGGSDGSAQQTRPHRGGPGRGAGNLARLGPSEGGGE